MALALPGCGDDDRSTASDAADPTDAGLPADSAAADGPDHTPGSDAATADAGPAPPPSDFPLDIGLGERSFDPIAHGDVALLQRGCQGAQHIWIGLRSPSLPPGDHIITLALNRAVDGAEAVPPHQLELPWVAYADGAELLGVTLVVFDPLAVVDAEADIHVAVEAPDGRIGRAVRRVRVEWGPDAC